MHLACNINKKIKEVLFIGLLLILNVGCIPTKIQYISIGEWIQELNRRAGIMPSDDKTNSIQTILKTDQYYEDICNAVQWGVIQEKDITNTSQKLNRDWTAYTLWNLIGKFNTIDSFLIEDLKDSQFPIEVQNVVNTHIMSLDSRNFFHPKDLINREEAITALNTAVDKINHRKIENQNMEIQWKDNAVYSIDSSYVQEDGTKAMFPSPQNIYKGDIVKWIDRTTQKELYKKVSSVVEENGFLILELDTIDFLEETDSARFSGSTEIDFSDATIEIPEQGFVQQRKDSKDLSLMSTYNFLSKSFQVKDFTISVTTGKSGIKAEAYKILSHGSKAYASIRVSGMKCDYDWLSEANSIKNLYFKVQFQCDEDLGLRNQKSKNLVMDFDKIDKDNILDTLKSSFVSKGDAIEQSITVAKITVPIPSSPMLSLSMNLDLNMRASGKIELVLTQGFNVGCEIRNGNIRMIHERQAKSDSIIQASAKMTSGLHFGLDLENIRLCDIGIQAGARSSADTIIHFYDSEGKHYVLKSDISPDFAANSFKNCDHIFACGNLEANWIGELSVNSKQSLAGKIGIGRTFSLLNNKNASLLPEGMHHIENFHFVKKCTYKDWLTGKNPDGLNVSDKITLDRYALALNIGEKKEIKITGLPKGYTKEELVFVSRYEDIVSVDKNGVLKGLKSGSSEITITTGDGAHEIHCTVLVKTS